MSEGEETVTATMGAAASQDGEMSLMSNPAVIGTVILGLLLAVFLMRNTSNASSSSSGGGAKARGGFSEEELLEESKAAAKASSAASKKKKKNKKKKPAAEKSKAAAVTPVQEEPPAKEPEPVVEEPEPAPEPAPVEPATTGGGGGGKKKKKKKKGAAAPEKQPEPVVEPPAPAPAPEPEPEPVPEPVAETSATDGPTSGKKKKKKKKKGKNSADAESETPATNGNAAAAASSAPTSTEYRDETPAVVEQWEPVKKNKGSKAVAATTVAKAASADSTDAEPVPTTATMKLGPDQPGLIIGPQGSTIRTLEVSTGCKFDVSKEYGNVKITGLPDQVVLATAAIQEILDEDAARQARQVTKTLQFDSNTVKAIIGKGGATIQDIEKRTGCKLDVNIDQGTCVVTGEQPHVDKAVTLCQNAVYGESQHQIDLKTRNAVNVVFGKNFETIRQLQDESGGAKLDLDRNSTILKLSGSIESVAKAKSLVENLLELNRGVEFPVKQKSVGAIYGKAGATIRSIQDRTNTFIEVNDSNTDADAICSIMGESNNVAEARRLIQMAIDGETELKPGEVLHTLDLGPGAPAVIGRGGSKIVELEKRHGVKIKVQSDTATCRIVGTKAAAAAAKEEIETIIKPMLEELKVAKLAEEAAAKGTPEWSAGPEDDELDGW